MNKTNVPAHLAHLPTYRGLPVPYVVLIDNDGNPHFRINNIDKENECIEKKLCHICGKPLLKEFWFIGGHLSAFHPRGAFNDPPVHKLCGLYALTTCPYMVNSNYKAADEAGTIQLAKEIAGKTDVKALYNPTQTNKRLDFFVFARAKSFTINYNSQLHGISTVTAHKPYLEVEYYKDGERIHRGEVLQILKDKKEQHFIK